MHMTSCHVHWAIGKYIVLYIKIEVPYSMNFEKIAPLLTALKGYLFHLKLKLYETQNLRNLSTLIVLLNN